jgi:hypothetical protein
LLGVVGGLVGSALVASLPLTAAVALGLALAVAVLPYLLPRRFQLNPEGLSIRQGFYITRRVWTDFEAFHPVKGGYLFQRRGDVKSKSNRPNLLLPGTTELFLASPLEPEKAAALEQALVSYLGELKTGTVAG